MATSTIVTDTGERNIDHFCVTALRTLAMDAVQAANSGHPGTPMAMAPVAYALWQRHLRFDPSAPIWSNRDRFVLSVGHASTLLYALLHLAGVKSVNPQYETLGEPAVSLDDLKAFRQLDSKLPGPPGVPLDRRGGVHHRPARHRHRDAASGWRSRRSGRRPPSTGPASSCSTTTCTRSAATAA